MAASDLQKLLGLQLQQPEAAAQPSQNEMLAQALIGLAPILAGAALGGAQGGAIGAQAGGIGLESLAAGKKQERERMEKLADKRRTDIMTALALGKEARAEQRQETELGLRKREVQAKEADVGKGSKLTSEQTQTIAGFTSADKQVEEIEKRIEENSDIMGPVVGRVAGAAGYGTRAKAFDARMKLAAQDIGKALEGGKLTDADIERYRAMLPNLQDTPEVAQAKASLLRELIANKRAASVEAFGAGGYNISKIPAPAVSAQKQMVEQQRSGLPSGLGPRDAVASQKPGYMGPAVMQNGVMYKWNEAKGQYE